MKRKFLEELGIEEEVVSKIMKQYGDDTTELKAKIDDLTEELNVKETTLKQKTQKISELEEVDLEKIKSEQFGLGKSEGLKETEDFKKQTAIEKLYNKDFEVDGKKYKVKDGKALQGYLDNEKIKYENNEITGLVEQFTDIAKTSPYLFETDIKTPQFAGTTQGTNQNNDENALRQAMGLEIKKD